MPELERGTVEANGLEFHYLASGSGPLALCLHGFPDSPWTYRHLLPALADAGCPRRRAVQPGSRRPAAGRPVTTCTRPRWSPTDRRWPGARRHGSDALLIAHDWGAVGRVGRRGPGRRRGGGLRHHEHPAVRDLRREPRHVRADQAVVLLLVLPDDRVMIEDRIRENDFEFIRPTSGVTGRRATTRARTSASCRTACASRTTCEPRSATTGASSTRRWFGSPEWADGAGAGVGRRHPAAQPLPARHERRLPRHEPPSSARGAGPLPGPARRVGADRGRRALHARRAPAGDQPADPRVSTANRSHQGHADRHDHVTAIRAVGATRLGRA